MAEEPVYAPDQLKPPNRGWLRIVGVVSIVSLLVMTRPFNNHTTTIEDLALLLTAAAIAALLVGDAVLRRNGLRS